MAFFLLKPYIFMPRIDQNLVHRIWAFQIMCYNICLMNHKYFCRMCVSVVQRDCTSVILGLQLWAWRRNECSSNFFTEVKNSGSEACVSWCRFDSTFPIDTWRDPGTEMPFSLLLQFTYCHTDATQQCFFWQGRVRPLYLSIISVIR